MVRDLRKPYRVIEDLRTRDFARWFWTEQRGELACLKSDFGLSFRPRLWRVGMSAVYLFHQRKYSERHRQGSPVDLDPAIYSSDRPLRLVAFDQMPTDSPAFQNWLLELERSFRLQQTETYVVQPGKPAEPWLRDAYVVLELIPRSHLEPPPGGLTANPARRRL